MNKTLLLVSVLMSMYVSGLLELQVADASPYKNIDVYTARNMMTNGSYPDLVVLDVRSLDEYLGGHIYGAVLIPHTALEARIGELAGHENHEIIVYCKAGSRSATASSILEAQNFTRVYNMLGGIQDWQIVGYPVVFETTHDIAVTEVRPCKTVIGQNQSMSVFVAVENKGDTIEDFNITLYYNTTVVETQDVNGLVVRTEANLTFTWNTTGIVEGNYTLKAEASVVAGETETADNTRVESVIVSILGDVDGNFAVDIYDIVHIALAFDSTPGNQYWNPNADVVQNNIVDIYDVVTVTGNFGKTDRG